MGRTLRGAIGAVVSIAAATVAAAGCGAPATATATDSTGPECAGERTLTCTYFDGTTRTWSILPPAAVSLDSACAAAGSHGEIDAFVDTPGQYWLDRIGFLATGSALRVAPLGASDDAGGATYGCGQGGGKVLTQLLCGADVGIGALSLRFTFAGHWSDASPWTKECDANVAVTP